MMHKAPREPERWITLTERAVAVRSDFDVAVRFARLGKADGALVGRVRRHGPELIVNAWGREQPVRVALAAVRWVSPLASYTPTERRAIERRQAHGQVARVFVDGELAEARRTHKNRMKRARRRRAREAAAAP